MKATEQSTSFEDLEPALCHACARQKALALIATERLTDRGSITLDEDAVEALYFLIFDQLDALEALKKSYYDAWDERHPQAEAPSVATTTVLSQAVDDASGQRSDRLIESSDLADAPRSTVSPPELGWIASCESSVTGTW